MKFRCSWRKISRKSECGKDSESTLQGRTVKMSILTVSVLGITAVLLAVQLKGKGGEYGTYIVMAAGCVSFSMRRESWK